MRSAYVMTDVLAADGSDQAALDRLRAANLQVTLVARHPSPAAAEVPSGTGADYGPVIGLDKGDDADPAAVLRLAGATAGGYVLAADPDEVLAAVSLACRPILVLGDRSLHDVFGADEPVHKEVAAAPDVASAVNYLLSEVATAEALGAFPFDQQQPLNADRVTRPLPLSGPALAKLLVAVVIAGVAIALGIAYLLKVVYQTYTFPPIAYYLTLQFISPAARGFLFLGLGALIGLLLPRLWRRLVVGDQSRNAA